MTSLWPPNATAYELAVEKGVLFDDDVNTAVDAIAGFKFARPLIASVAPYLIWEYGLSGIERFFDTAEDAIDAGIPWSRTKGFVSASRTALEWIGYENPVFHDDQHRRRCWGRGQIGMGELPGANEVGRLFDAYDLLELQGSLPARSRFFRGFHGYDVRAAETGYKRTARSIIGDSSGVRIAGNPVKWSHGRDHVLQATASSGEREDLGVNYQNGDVLTWGSWPWSAPGVTWNGITDAAAFKAFMIARLSAYVAFFDADDTFIGYRRVGQAVENVTGTVDPGDGLAAVKFECRTGFGDGAGQAVASAAIAFGVNPSDDAKPGTQWLEPNQVELTNAVVVGKTAAAFTFALTQREHVTFTLTI